MTDLLHIAVAPDVDPYWRALLTRSGLPVRDLGAGDHGAAVLFLPDAAGLRSRVLRGLVAALRRVGRPVLAGRQWEAATAIRREERAPLTILPLPDARALLRPNAIATALGDGGESSPVEIITAVDHGGLRRRIEAALRELAFAVGQPFVRLGHLPNGHDGALAIRIDADSYRSDATATVVAMLERARLRATWCIDVERHLRCGGMPAVAALAAAGHEVQSHFFHHYTYRSARKNLQNLQRSLRELAAIGIVANAAVAPFGSWNRGLGRALATAGMRWSSEFSRSYDDVPGPLSGRAGEVWQVPIHPVCPALFAASASSDGTIEAWFRRELARCQQNGEPAVFYGHPIGDLGRCPELLPRLAVSASAACDRLWQPTLGELFDFAVARSRQAIAVHARGKRLVGDCHGPAALRLEYPNGEVHVANGAIDLPRFGREPLVILPRPAAIVATPPRRHLLHTKKLQLARMWRELRT
jgi:hypothetical protein